MMSELFDEQALREAYDEAMKKEFRAVGTTEGKIDVAINLLSLGTLSIEDISKVTGFTLERIKELAAQDKTVTS